MKTFATLAMIALFAVSAFAADIAKGPAVVDGKVTQYEDSINRGDCAVIAHIDGTFTDLTIPYSDALIAAGKSPDIIYDPFGSADLSGYEGVVASAADLWWAYDFAGDEAAYAAFLDGGGALLFVGQDYIYSRGGIDGFPSDYMAILDVVEDVNYGSEEIMDLVGTAGGPLDGYTDSVAPCFASNPWYTDNIVPLIWGAVEFTDPSVGMALEGGATSMNTVFSAVEFGCGPNLNAAMFQLVLLWEGTTATEEASWSTIKAMF